MMRIAKAVCYEVPTPFPFSCASKADDCVPIREASAISNTGVLDICLNYADVLYEFIYDWFESGLEFNNDENVSCKRPLPRRGDVG